MIYAVKYQYDIKNRQLDARRQKVLSKALLEYAFISENGSFPGNEAIRYGTHGKPSISESGLHYNITNSKGLVCCIVAKHEVGIDAEHIRPYKDRLVKRTCTEDEYQQVLRAPNPSLMFIRFWTLKESYVKYLGTGLGYGIKRAAFFFSGGIPHRKDEELFINQQVLCFDNSIYALSVCAGNEVDCTMRLIPEEKLYTGLTPRFSETEYIHKTKL